jgi:hypothetical protein
MRKLVNFLVEEKYCNTQSEAIKILESVSDEFYNYLIEAEISATDLINTSNRQLRQELSKRSPNPKLILHLTKKIKGLRGPASAESTQRPKTSKGLSPTPTGRGGRRVQKPGDQISTIGTTAGIQRTDTGKYSRAATILTGTSPESRGRQSVDSGRTRTSELVGDRFTDKAVSGAGGTNQARSGGTRGVRTRNG